MVPKILRNDPQQRNRNGVKNLFQCSDCQGNIKNISTKFHEKILKGSEEIEEHTLKQLVQKYLKTAASRDVNYVNKKFQCSDHQLSAANIYTKFHEKILNDSQKIEEHALEWAPGGHDMNKIYSVVRVGVYQEHLYKIS